MLDVLANLTRQHQTAVDDDLLGLLKRPTPARYSWFLRKTYCFEAAIEAALASTPKFDRGLLRTHMKTHCLAADLEALGARPTQVSNALCFASLGEALGWMYVVQRGTLIHGLVSRQLARTLPHENTVAGSYLSAFEGCAGAKLREVGDVLDATARRPCIVEEIVAAANQALRCQRWWYSSETTRSARTPTTAVELQAA